VTYEVADNVTLRELDWKCSALSFLRSHD
jgi:hypothetical protein